MYVYNEPNHELEILWGTILEIRKELRNANYNYDDAEDCRIAVENKTRLRIYEDDFDRLLADYVITAIA